MWRLVDLVMEYCRLMLGVLHFTLDFIGSSRISS